MKSEPDVFGFDDLLSCPAQTEPWDGVRNYQARNFMRDDMKVGDRVLFYHSNCKPPHVAGVAEIASPARPDMTAFDPSTKYYDAKSKIDNPRWFLVDVKAIERLPRPVSLQELKDNARLDGMLVTQRGQRLSIQPVQEKHYLEVIDMARGAGS